MKCCEVHADTVPGESPAITTQLSPQAGPAATAPTAPKHASSNRHSPIPGSQTRTVLSSLPLTILVPSGVTTTDVTRQVWPVSGSPVARSHTCQWRGKLFEGKRPWAGQLFDGLQLYQLSY